MKWRPWASELAIFLLIPSWACILAWYKFLPNQLVGLFPSFLISSGPLAPFLFFFFFFSTCLLAIISCHVSPLGVYLSYWTFITHLLYLLPSIVLIGLLATIPTTLNRWVFSLFFLSFHGSFTLLLPLVVSMSLLDAILATLAYWVFFTSFLGLSWPIYFTFTSCCAHELAGYYSCHVGLLGFLHLFLGFHGPFTLLLPLVVHMGLLAAILATLAHWVLLPLFLGFHSPFAFIMFLPFFSSFIFLHYWAFLLLGSLSKTGINKYEFAYIRTLIYKGLDIWIMAKG